MKARQNVIPPADLRAARKAAGLSQPELSRLSGVKQATISEVERGLRDPRFSTLVKLADVIRAFRPRKRGN